MAAYLISQSAVLDSSASLALSITGVRFFAVGRAAFRYAERYVGHVATFRVLTRLRGLVLPRDRTARTGAPGGASARRPAVTGHGRHRHDAGAVAPSGRAGDRCGTHDGPRRSPVGQLLDRARCRRRGLPAPRGGRRADRGAPTRTGCSGLARGRPSGSRVRGGRVPRGARRSSSPGVSRIGS